MDFSLEEDGYASSAGSVDEDAELELSCALHDLALRVKTFEADMQGRFLPDMAMEEEEEEITEDISHLEDDGAGRYFIRHRLGSDASVSDVAGSKRRAKRRRSSGAKMAKPEDDEDEDEYGDESQNEDESDEERPEAKSMSSDEDEAEWDSQEEKEELCELKQNIAKLLESMQQEAKALTSDGDDNQAK